MYSLIKEINEEGIYFPVWAVCQGFEVLLSIEAGSFDVLEVSTRWFKPSSLMIENDASLFGMSKSDLEMREMTYNVHHLGISEEKWKLFDLNKSFQIISYSFDDEDQLCVTTAKHLKYPFVVF